MSVSVVKAAMKEMRRSVTYMPRPGDGAPRGVTLIPGDGIGPLVTNAVEQVMEAMHAPLYFEKYEVHGDMRRVPEEVLDSIRKNKVCLKGGLRTPVGGGVSSLNVQLRKDLDLYASLVNCFNLPGLPTRHDNVDIVVIRENTEGEYSGLEHEVVPGVVESLKVKLLSPLFEFTIHILILILTLSLSKWFRLCPSFVPNVLQNMRSSMHTLTTGRKSPPSTKPTSWNSLMVSS